MLKVFKSRFVSFALLLALAGCAERSTSSGLDENLQKELTAKILEAMTEQSLSHGKPSNVSLSQFTVQVALQEISALHIAPHRTLDLVSGGFASLAEESSDLGFDVGKTEIVVTHRDEEVYRFHPPPDGAYALWAERIETSINSILQQRPSGARPDPDSALDAFLDGMSSDLDRFTRFYPRADVLQHQRYEDGETARIGVDVEPTRAGAVIQRISDFSILDSDALRRGDTIVSIDGLSLAGRSSSTITNFFYGPPDSAATLTILRSGQRNPVSVTVRRKKADETALRTRRIGDLLYVQVASMPARVGAHLTDALRKASGPGGTELEGAILDFRGNSGGLLDSGLAIADPFLAEGEMVSILGRTQADNQSIRARENAPTNSLPLVVLIDRDTAGSAEIAASALQDLDRAVVIGQPSLGQGLVQIGRRLPTGGVLTITWGEAVAPAGYRINGRGVMPTVCTGGNNSAEGVLAALRKGVGVIDRATRGRDIDPEDRDAVESLRALCPPRNEGADIDVGVAQALLHDPELFSLVLQRGRGQRQAAEAERH